MKKRDDKHKNEQEGKEGGREDIAMHDVRSLMKHPTNAMPRHCLNGCHFVAHGLIPAE